MTNTKRLKAIIAQRGVKIAHLIGLLGCSYLTFRKKLNNETEFTASEIDILCDALQIRDLETKEDLFFYK